MNKRLLKLVIAGALIVPTASAFAATSATTTFTTSATVVASCQVAAANLSFGNVDPLSATATDATSDITVTCSKGTAYTVGLNAGATTGATTTTRQMLDSNSDAMNYGLYTDSAHATNWDDIGGTKTQAGTGTGSAQTLTVYGEVPTGQTALPPGAYSDTVTVTVSY
ncbi:MAG TPA: spore coat U domain-containing protein [Gammaproteobacteria bacterium]|nr:spore coat U domain-containing protein [Gammaproteobacteria bacterium]